MTHGAPNEALRFERLRAQDGKPLAPPPSVQPLCTGGGLNPVQEHEAIRQMQAAADEMRSMPSYPAEERLFWIAFLLARYYAGNDQRQRLHQLIGRVLPSLQQARHQQIMLGLMARNAAAMGDMNTATQILPQLDPTSDDLQIDTSYRFTTAYVALLRNDPRTALSVLGTNIDDVPMSDAYDLVCGVYRAHAHEALGNFDLAKQQLQRLAPTPQALASVEEIARLIPQIQLCQRTLPAIKELTSQAHGGAIVTNSGIKVGRLVLIPLIGTAVALGLSGMASGTMTEMFGSSLPIPASAIITIVMVVLIMGFTFSQVLKGPAQRKRLMQTGVEGMGQITMVEQTGTQVNNQPMLRLRMLITLPGQSPYSVIHNEIVPVIRLAHVQPGATMRVRVDPRDKKKMAIAWQ